MAFSFVRAHKTVNQGYTPTPEIINLLKDYRAMVNDAIRIILDKNITGLTKITKQCYYALSAYHYNTDYRLVAINAARGMVSNYRRAMRKGLNPKKPFVRQPFIKTIARPVWINDGVMRMAYDGKSFIYIKLTPYVLAAISGYTVRSVVLKARTLSITYSKDTVTTEPTGLIGIDRNLDNITTSNLDGKTVVYDLSQATLIKERYRRVKSHFRRNDVRIKQRLFSKYGGRQRNRVNQILHNTSNAVIKQAKDTDSGIVMEDLTGIRKMYRKGNGQGVNYRAKLNGWSFFKLQQMIEYKAKWQGIPVIYIHPAKTSSRCAICGAEVTECTGRKVWCHRCMKLMDRDENAAFNIVKQGLKQKPDGFASEAMVQESSQGVILTVDANKGF